MKNRQFRITGRLVDRKSGIGVCGLRVEAWDKDFIVDDFVGRAEQTDVDGHFVIEFNESYFHGLFHERYPDLFFRIFKGSDLIFETEPLIYRFGSQYKSPDGLTKVIALPDVIPIDIQIEFDAPAGTLLKRYRVQGTVSRSDGTPVSKALVRAFSCNSAPEVLLGESVSNASGRYEIRYNPEACGCPATTVSVNLVVRGAHHNLVEVASSEVIYDARPDEIVNLVMHADQNADQHPGKFLDGCHIDLPPGDVIEKIEFERIIIVNNTLADLKASWPKVWPDIASETWKELKDCNLALYLPFTQQWELKGYTRGRLVKSFSLGPGEEQTVELFTWDRLKTQLESTTSYESEQSAESASTRRDALDVTQDVSRQSGFQMSTSGKVGFKAGGVVDVDMNQQITGQTSVNEHAINTRNTIAEATTKSASKIRTTRTVKVTESREYGSEERVTRKLRNANTFHTLNVPFFEILANQRVTTTLRHRDVRLVVLVDAPGEDKIKLNPDDDPKAVQKTVREHETALRLALLDRELEPGFAAARFLDALDRSCNILCTGCKCGDEPVMSSRAWRKLASCAKEIGKATQTMLSWQEYSPEYLGGAAFIISGEEIKAVVKSSLLGIPVIGPILDALGLDNIIDIIVDAIQGLINNTHLFASLPEAKFYIKTYLFRTALKKKTPGLVEVIKTTISTTNSEITETQADTLGMTIGDLSGEALTSLKFDQGISDDVRDEIRTLFLVRIGASLGPVLLPILLVPNPDIALSLILAGLCQGLADCVRDRAINFEPVGIYDLVGLEPLLKAFNSFYKDWDKDEAANQEALIKAVETARIDRAERESRILASFGLRETAEAKERLDALIGHLTDDLNKDHYKFAMMSERKGLFFDGDEEMKLITYGVLEATPVASIGNKFAVPVRLQPGTVFYDSFETIKTELTEAAEPDVSEHILPTAALYSEAIVGVCCASEQEAIERHNLEMRQKHLENELQVLEAERLRARLDARPPLLNKECPIAMHLNLAVGEPVASPKELGNP